MGLRILEREARKRDDLRLALLREAAERFGAFKGDASLERVFMEKVESMRDHLGNMQDASAVAARVKEDIRRENKRSMAIVGTLNPDIVLDLL